MNALIIGDRSEIAAYIGKRLRDAGWNTWGWNRLTPNLYSAPVWDMALIALGTVAPVGAWNANDADEWEACFEANLFLPVRLLRELRFKAAPEATVCFMAGSNPNKAMPGYSAYNASKMALLKFCEQLHAEDSGLRAFALGPGYVPTKIHKPTLEAGWENPVIKRGEQTNSLGRIYDCLMWAHAQPRAAVGGRNICASDAWGKTLTARLLDKPDLYKLRRMEWIE